MSKDGTDRTARDLAAGSGAVLGGMVIQFLGAALAKGLFGLIGPLGMASLRLVFAALVLMLARRAWRRVPPRSAWPALAVYGVAFGVMNLSIYQAFARIPIALGAGIETLGPLGVALWASRRGLDVVWFAVGCLGLALLMPLGGHAGAPVSLSGMAFALLAGGCWALYILAGRQVAPVIGGDAVAWGMMVAALPALPVAFLSDGIALLHPHILALGLGVALLSSALPYSLEMEAMRRLPTSTMGILLSTAPAMACLVGYVALGERLAPLQGLAVGLFVVAAVGSMASAARIRRATGD